jgi:hypothetical protein
MAGCQSTPDKVIHPVPTQFPADSVIDHRIDFSKNRTGKLPDLYHPDSLRQIGKIGKDSVIKKKSYYYNTTPNNIDIDPDGNIYMVQKQNNTINVYAADGTFKYSIGRTGRGPGEFLDINTFDFSSEYNKLYILGFRRIEIFKLDDNRYKPHDRIHLSHFNRTYDLCVLDNYLFISGFKVDPEQEDSLRNLEADKAQTAVLHGLTTTKPISRFNLQTSEMEFNFGYKYHSMAGFGPASGLLSETKLSCNEKTNTVIGILGYFPYLFGYSLDGETKWRSTIENFTSIQSIEKLNKDRPPTLSRISNKNIYNWYYPSREIGNSRYSLLQVGYALPEKDYEKSLPEPPYKTLAIDSKSGKILLSESYGIIGAQKDDLVITITDREPESYIYRFNIHKR